jgi:hypothetical protein
VSSNLQLYMRLNWDGSRAAAGLNQASAQVKRFADGASKQLSGVRKTMSAMSADFGGVSNITRLVGAYAGLQTAREAMAKNMDFDKIMLESKQLAEMTEAQSARMRSLALELSKANLATPLENADAIRTLANAGMKYEEIEETLKRLGPAAAAFRSSMKEMADLDYDLITKFRIDPKQLDELHNMVYYHAKAGRFEAKAISSFAPQYLAATSLMGISASQGMNFTGGLLQALQKIKPQTNPGEVVTLIEHGLSHLINPRETKHLKQVTGIDIKKFAPNGKFAGEDGLQGLFGLVEAMRKAGLHKDQYKLASVFRDAYERQFWTVVLKDFDAIKAAMQQASLASKANQIGKDYAEIMTHDYAKSQLVDNALERAKQSRAVTAGVNIWTALKGFAVENPLQALMLGGGLVLGGKMLYGRMAKGKGGAAGGMADAAMGLAGVQRVFVVNMPGAGGMGGGQLALPPGAGWSPEQAAKAARWKNALGAAKSTALVGGAFTAATTGLEAYNVYKDTQLNAEAKKTEYGRIAGGAAGEIGGMVIGGMIGSLAGPAGTVIGASIAGAIGKHLGEWAGKELATSSPSGGAMAQGMVIRNVLDIHLDGDRIYRNTFDKAARESLRGAW